MKRGDQRLLEILLDTFLQERAECGNWSDETDLCETCFNQGYQSEGTYDYDKDSGDFQDE